MTVPLVAKLAPAVLALSIVPDADTVALTVPRATDRRRGLALGGLLAASARHDVRTDPDGHEDRDQSEVDDYPAGSVFVHAAMLEGLAVSCP